MKCCQNCRKWYPISDTMGMCYAPGEFIKLAHESCGRWEHETARAQKEDAAEEAQANQTDILTYSPVSPTSEGYNALTAEIIKGGGKRG